MESIHLLSCKNDTLVHVLYLNKNVDNLETLEASSYFSSALSLNEVIREFASGYSLLKELTF